MAVRGCGGFGTPTVLVLLRSKEQINKIINYLMNDGEAETNITANSHKLQFTGGAYDVQHKGRT